MSYKVKLTYFKLSGKYYSDGEYVSEHEELYQIWAEVKRMQDVGRLPGLVEGARMPFIAVKVKKHPHRHPTLIVDELRRSS